MNSWIDLPHSVHDLVADTSDAILLQTVRFNPANHSSYLFLDPIEVLAAYSLEDVSSLFARLEAALAQGHHLAGYLGYECGFHFEHFPSIPPSAVAPGSLPLAWFGVYPERFTFDHATGLFDRDLPKLPLRRGISTQPFTDRFTLSFDEGTYRRNIQEIKDLITAGDTYQVNFTGQLSCRTTLSPAAAFTTLCRRQPVSYAALLNIAGHHILSLSPELFFKLDGDEILTRPMKGTMPRGLDLLEDEWQARALQQDEKNRSEHIMIVDLLRNDLGRLCTHGSVRAEDLFTIERYATLLQMTSGVAGTLRPGLTFYEIFRALFPSGSITGAPKIRTMQIIHSLESTPRGIYTGAIGHIAPATSSAPRSATFNVAIRTLVLKNGQARMGVGGGIVADSDPAAEYRECLLKAAFLTRSPDDFNLIETILWQPSERAFYLLPFHLDRLAASASYFNFAFSRTSVRAQLEDLAKTFREPTPYRVRLLLASSGVGTLTATPFTPAKPTGRISLAAERTSSDDLFLRHKTTRRSLYDRLYQQATTDGFDEIIFLNERGELTEGAISNLFLRTGEHLLTPPLSSGVLPGIYRRHVLETRPGAAEAVLTLQDLQAADAIFICNSIRGMNKVTLAAITQPVSD